MFKQPLAVSMGDPAGVGPELCLRLLAEPAVLRQCVPLVFGDADVLRAAARQCALPYPKLTVPIEVLTGMAAGQKPAGPAVIDNAAIAAQDVRPGRVRPSCGRAAYVYIQAALEAVRAGRAAALVTAPINKEALRAAGIPFAGHTDMLAAMTGAVRHAMMLASERIIVSLVTTHVPYAEVPALLTGESILNTIELTAGLLRRLGRRRLRIAVCGLNPHGGEGGLLGREEEEIIAPTVREAVEKGLNVTGPLPPDTAFIPERLRETDAYVAMYHDQGLIPFKTLAFETGVNITLGLPIVRTSPGHGTAFDIAWQGKASATGMIEAVRWAVRLAASAGQGRFLPPCGPTS